MPQSIQSDFLILLLLCSTLSVGCGSYSDSTQRSRLALLRGDSTLAVSVLNQTLEHQPENSEHLLLLLERGIALQQSEEYQASTLDLQRADEGLEVIDYTKTPIKDLGTYLYSDDSSPYRPPPFEKAMINVFNMINYLALKEWSKAKVEVRRLAVLESFWDEALEEAAKIELNHLRQLIHWMSAFTYIATGDSSLALKEAERGGFQLPSAPQRPVGQKYSPVLIVSSSGMVPHKVAQRIPLGRALLLIGPHHTWDQQQRAKLARVQAKGLMKWLNFPSLSSSASGGRQRFMINQTNIPPVLRISLSQLVRSSFNKVQPLLIVAAITRLLTRAVVGEVTEALGKRGRNHAVGFLLGLVAEGSLAVADTPDTRSWSNLPDQLQLYWLWLPPGQHTLSAEHDTYRWQKVLEVNGDGTPFVLNFPALKPTYNHSDR
jgi:hypothetical protein